MPKFNTGNPVGSSDPRDLFDNAAVADNLVTGDKPTYGDRLGKSRRSWRGMENEFAAFIAASGYEFVGDYAADIEISGYNQIVRDAAGEFWRLSGPIALPYTTTGEGLPEGGAFVAVGDAALRQELNGPLSSGQGAALVRGATIYVRSVAELEVLSVPVGASVQTLGYYLPGDGGGNDYQIVAAGTGTADGGSFIDLTSGLQAKGLFLTGINVLQFGAKGDGTLDESYFDALEATTRDAQIPEGNYDSGQDSLSVTSEYNSKALFKDADTGEYHAPVFRKRFNDLTRAFDDKVLSAKSGGAPVIVCYGDSNTRYYEGDTSTAGPYSKSYGAYIDLACTFYPHLYQATVNINGYPGQTASYGATNFSANVPPGTSYVVVGFGTNNVKLASPDIESYLSDMSEIIAKSLAQDTQPIVLGIPWFDSAYGDDGVTSQQRIKVWNSRLMRLCEDSGVPFIDTYSLTAEYGTIYFNEVTTSKRHYSAVASRAIGSKIVEIISDLMSSTGRASFRAEAFDDTPWIKTQTGVTTRRVYENGGMTFETLEVLEGDSITISGSGRGCLAFYPREAATVDFSTGLQSGSVTITPAIDNGVFYTVKRQALFFQNSGKDYDLTLTATSGNFYLRAISFEDGAILGSSFYGASFQEVASSAVPAQGTTGRTYFLTDMAKPAWWVGTAYRGAEGRITIGTTSVRDSQAALGVPNGYKFYNTTTGTVQTWDGSTWS